MKKSGRIQKSADNFFAGITNRLVSTVLSFVIRTVFIHYLSAEYLSVNGLYSGILTMLSFAEMGFGVAMTYSMYKPLAEKDDRKLSQLMVLYRRVYFRVGCVILALGLSVIPFMDLIIKNPPDIDGLTFYYLIFLLNSVLSYWFFAYRTSILSADQRSSVISYWNTVFSVAKTILQIVLLVLFRNYTLYLLAQIACTIGQNILLSIKAKKEYPVFDFKTARELSKEEKGKIFADTRALMLRKLAFSILHSSDTIIISSMVGVNWVGLLSNYVLIEDAVTSVLTQLTWAITASLGNYFANEDTEAGYHLFRRVEFLNFWLYSFCSVAMVTLMTPFVQLWLGESFILGQWIVAALILRFFTAGYTNTMSTFRTTLGLFVQGKYIPLFSAIVNICLSVSFSIRWGVAGVLFATSLTRLSMDMWYTPRIIFHERFKKNVSQFFLDYLLRLGLLALTAFGMARLAGIVVGEGVTIARFVMLLMMTAILPNLIFLFVFRRREEFRELLAMAKSFVRRRSVE
ncbi:MAG: oligosaccharide flippase family protein [Clostridia bacterium]|nr:oligosaccharide flippase family protein [Clostridia bacterium]